MKNKIRNILAMLEPTRMKNLSDINDDKTLTEIVLLEDDTYTDEEKLEAVKKIKDSDTLRDIAIDDTRGTVSEEISKNIIKDQRALEDIALKAKHDKTRWIAITKINKQEVLRETALKDKHVGNRRKSIEKLKRNDAVNQNLFKKIIFKEKEFEVKKETLNKINDKNTLTLLADKDDQATIRMLATKRLRNLFPKEKFVHKGTEKIISKVLAKLKTKE